MAYYARLMGLFLRNDIQREMTFRANFLISLLHTALGAVAGLAGVLVVFGQVDEFRGWSLHRTLVLLGVYLLVGALQRLSIRPSLDSLAGLGGDVWQGTFDFTLLKPVPAQFLISCRRWQPWAMADLAVSLVVLGIGVAGLGQRLSAAALLGWVASLAVSLTVVYSILLLLSSGVFWYQGAPLAWFFDSLVQTGRYPVGIYPGWLRLVLTWVVPVGFITTVPAEALSGHIEPLQLAAGAVLAVVLFGLASAFFGASLRRYSSASS